MDSDLEDEHLIGWVRETGKRARLLPSPCDGAFVLARAGLLDGLEATTFPGDQDRFGASFPQVKRYHVERLYGAGAARRVGRGLVIDWDLAAVRDRRAPGALLPGGVAPAAGR